MAKCERGRKCFAQQSISASVNADSAVMHGERGHSSNARRTWTCTANVDMHGERGHARRTWTQQQAYRSVEPEGCCGSKELARGGDISPHRQGPRSVTLGYVSLAGSSQHSPRATLCRYSVAGPVGWQTANEADNLLHNKPSAPQRTRTQPRT